LGLGSLIFFMLIALGRIYREFEAAIATKCPFPSRVARIASST
jgi:hypothetical protein